MKLLSKVLLWTVIVLSADVCLADTQVNVVGLFSNKAVVIVNGGKPKTLSIGQMSDGVKLLAADSKACLLYTSRCV